MSQPKGKDFASEDDMDNEALRMKIAELTSVIARLGEQVEKLSDKLEHIRDSRLLEVDKSIVLHTEKLSKLEKLVYGACAIMGAQAVTGIIAIVVWIARGGKAIP